MTMKSEKGERRRTKPYPPAIYILNFKKKKNVTLCAMCGGFTLRFKQDSFHRRPKGWRLKER